MLAYHRSLSFVSNSNNMPTFLGVKMLQVGCLWGEMKYNIMLHVADAVYVILCLWVDLPFWGLEEFRSWRLPFCVRQGCVGPFEASLRDVGLMFCLGGVFDNMLVLVSWLGIVHSSLRIFSFDGYWIPLDLLSLCYSDWRSRKLWGGLCLMSRIPGTWIASWSSVGASLCILG